MRNRITHKHICIGQLPLIMPSVLCPYTQAIDAFQAQRWVFKEHILIHCPTFFMLLIYQVTYTGIGRLSGGLPWECVNPHYANRGESNRIQIK